MDKKDSGTNTGRISSIVTKLAQNIQQNVDKLYQNVHYAKPDNYRSIETIRNRMNKSIDDAITNNINNVGLSSVASLYSRVADIQGDKDVINQISDVFDNKSIMDNLIGTYTQNTYIKDLDNEVDVVCKYMPKLLEALDTRKDNVLSADHFNKDFVNIKNEASIVKDGTFNKRISEMKKKYKIAELFEGVYDDAAKYGEQFVYIVPYKKALSKLLQNKASTVGATMNLAEGAILYENNVEQPFKLDSTKWKGAEFDNKIPNVKLELNTTNMILDVVSQYKKADTAYKTMRENCISLNEESKLDLRDAEGAPKKKTLAIDKGGYTDKLDLSGLDDTANDGMVLPSKNTVDKENKVEVPGCVVKRLDRASVIPVYIEDMCLGYYYIEALDSNSPGNELTFTNTLSGLRGGYNPKVSQQPDSAVNDQMLRYVSGQLSRFIDKKFINANQDLTREIYLILKHNDTFNAANKMEKLRVTFLPPEDVEHVYFKKDQKTNRGISDLIRALFPAKLYSSLYVTNTLAILTRGQDKRVYYVKQSVDQNIAGVLINTINQIKKSNFGIRQVENMNTVMNVTGRFNDYVIPTNANGDAPVQFEVMQGQNVEVKTDLMNILEEMAVNSTDVPLELIQARQSMDYAIHYTMTNSKFLKKVYNRQSKCKTIFSNIITRIYNAEYEEDEELEVKLPPPMFLNVTNTGQIFDTTNQLVENIVTMYAKVDEDDNAKAEFSKSLKNYYLSSYIDTDAVEKMLEEARMKAAAMIGTGTQQ